MKINVAALSDTGRVRSGNEDSFLASAPLFAVADGMGGHLAGEVASAAAVNVLLDKGGKATTLEDLEALLKEANHEIWEMASNDQALKGMGTTCTTVLLDGGTALIAHVGDSRAYLFRGGRLRQITEDHTLVARMVKEGRLAPEDAHHHPQRSIITRALGIDDEVEVDLLEQQVGDQDRLMICSDGLTGMVGPGAIEEILEAEADPDEAVRRMVALANDAGGEDNITIVLLDVVGDGDAHSSDDPPAVVPAPVRREATPAEPAPQEPSGRFARGVLKAGILVAALVVTGYFGLTYARDNLMWYVGVDEAGSVTIFHGMPEDIAGFDLSKQARRTELTAEDLPEFVRADLDEGHKVESLEEAESYVENLQERINDFSEPNGSTPSPQSTRG
ncbi:MAG TPA: Stp1/IreP family PP2C-type Ser/Thr phosphatase [Actinomycetota bacterium]|nr:Stp1/IreP family PP2C-type Ser/Thr phosphatase [Actinomycetota bacterium]